MSDDKFELDLKLLLDELDAMDARQYRVRSLRKKKQYTWKSVLSISALLVCVAVFAYSAWYLIDYWVDAKRQEALYNNLSNIVGQGRPSIPEDIILQPPEEETTGGLEADPTGENDTSIPSEPTDPVILTELQTIYEMNSDLVGWINIPGTRIDYPVTQSQQDFDYYLDHDFQKNWNPGGCIFARTQCDVFKPSDNVVLYGHNMLNGSMFASLNNYTNKEFWQENQVVFFDTLYERHIYRIVAVFKTSANPGQGFDYHLFTNASSQKEFDDFMAQVHKLQFYDTGVTAKYGDKLLTLSTCEYTLDNGRLVVVAKRIR